MDIISYALSRKYTDKKIASLPVPFKPSGTITFAQLPAQPVEADLGKIWNISEDFTTDARFIEGAGKKVDAGNNVGVIVSGNNYYFDVFSMIDFSKLTTYTVEEGA